MARQSTFRKLSCDPTSDRVCSVAPLSWHQQAWISGWTLLALSTAQPLVHAAPPTPRFSYDVLPILSEYCFPCHGPDENGRKGGLRLDLAAEAFKPGKSGKLALVPGKSAESELFHRIITADPDEVMPPPKLKKPLTTEQQQTLKAWIDSGAKWGRHWAFEKPLRPELPLVTQPGWVRTDLDRLVLARIESAGLAPSPEAPKRTLFRRLALDLTGLPPSPEMVEAFVQDNRPDAYERWVDRLIGSPEFGERMAWDWLDVARYADSNGYQGDNDRTMWPWRDWVVDAFNSNLPFDQFTVWQLAGDLLPNATREQKLATGFCRNHMINGEGGRIPEENRVDYVQDMTETVGTAWLGLTLTCSRCHDHKYDPIRQSEYFGMFAAFNQTPVTGGDGSGQAAPNLEMPSQAQAEERSALANLLAESSKFVGALEDRKFQRPPGEPLKSAQSFTPLPKDLQEALTPTPDQRDSGKLEKLAAHWKSSDPEYSKALGELRTLRDRQSRLNGAIPRVMVMEDRKEFRETFILTRGQYNKPANKVEFAVPAALHAFPSGASSNRLGMAQWLVSSENPLTSRVVINRLWSQFFGYGLVKTPEDFGLQGEKPTHPELLDWLAVEFMESGWDWKHVCRQIVLSATYRQSSASSPELVERDPQNRFLARGPRFRMPSWMIRDQALAASGLLAHQKGGAPVNPYQPPGVWEEATFGNRKYSQVHGEGLYRRSLYTFWRRIVGPTVFFDSAPRQVCSVKLPRTNTPLHALTTLNDVTFVEAARALATRLLRDASSPEARLQLAWQRLLARPASPEELRVLLDSLGRYQARFTENPAAVEQLLNTGESPRDRQLPAPELAAYTVVCSTLLNLDETLTKE